MRAVFLFLNSDFKAIETLLHHKRHTLLYASEGHAAIQYLRAMMTFSKEAMHDAQTAANNTINLATRFRKPRGVGAILSASTSREGSRGTKPDWYALRGMTPLQRHAELVHAEAYLLRAMLNIGTSGGAMAFLKEGWHVKSAYATYRDCYSYIQAEYAVGNMVDDHFVSGTYLGMGVFNLILSMLPARLLRFVEFVGFSADRKLGLELLAIAAGWRTEIHPCGYGLRSEFCSIMLQMYHTMFCYDLFLGYPNLPLVEKVIHRSIAQHPQSLIFMYFNGRSHVIHTELGAAIKIFDRLIANDPPSDSDWRQLQYLGYWERSLCLMALGRWLEAAQGFNTLRTENNWNKAVYTYGLASCLWEHYLVQCGGTAPNLMKTVPSLTRKVAGKSIPIEKYLVRKAHKFALQECFLQRPGLELIHVW
ncbi:hypothetical protein DL89DRAFT_223795, partial [Linderina pennispora]